MRERMSGRAVLAMSEDDLLRAVLDMARVLGVRSAHFRPARIKRGDGSWAWVTPVQGDGKGYPDITLAGRSGVLFRELKSDTGTLEPDQQVWASALAAAGADFAVWRPEDLRSGRIERELRAVAARRVRQETR